MLASPDFHPSPPPPPPPPFAPSQMIVIVGSAPSASDTSYTAPGRISPPPPPSAPSSPPSAVEKLSPANSMAAMSEPGGMPGGAVVVGVVIGLDEVDGVGGRAEGVAEGGGSVSLGSSSMTTSMSVSMAAAGLSMSAADASSSGPGAASGSAGGVGGASVLPSIPPMPSLPPLPLPLPPTSDAVAQIPAAPSEEEMLPPAPTEEMLPPAPTEETPPSSARKVAADQGAATAAAAAAARAAAYPGAGGAGAGAGPGAGPAGPTAVGDGAAVASAVAAVVTSNAAAVTGAGGGVDAHAAAAQLSAATVGGSGGGSGAVEPAILPAGGGGGRDGSGTVSKKAVQLDEDAGELVDRVFNGGLSHALVQTLTVIAERAPTLQPEVQVRGGQSVPVRGVDAWPIAACLGAARARARVPLCCPPHPPNVAAPETREQSNSLVLLSISKKVDTRCRSPSFERFLEGCSSPFMRLAEHLTALCAWCKHCLPDVLRPGLVRMRGSMVMRLRPSTN